MYKYLLNENIGDTNISILYIDIFRIYQDIRFYRLDTILNLYIYLYINILETCLYIIQYNSVNITTGAFNLSPMMPRDASLSDSYTSHWCCFFF